jgi:hypothetical protein
LEVECRANVGIYLGQVKGRPLCFVVFLGSFFGCWEGFQWSGSKWKNRREIIPKNKIQDKIKKKKVNFSLCTMNVYWGRGGIAPLILDLGIGWMLWQTSRSSCFTRGNPGHILHSTGSLLTRSQSLSQSRYVFKIMIAVFTLCHTPLF